MAYKKHTSLFSILHKRIRSILFTSKASQRDFLVTFWVAYWDFSVITLSAEVCYFNFANTLENCSCTLHEY